MVYLSDTQRIQILILRGFGDKKRTYEEVTRIFNELNPQHVINRSTVCKTIKRYTDTGNVKNCPKSGRPKTATDDDTKLNVLLQVEENAQVSSNQLALDNNIAQTSVIRIMKSEKMKPYKIHYNQELAEDDPDRRLQFCELVEGKKNVDVNFEKKLYFLMKQRFASTVK
ncbi:hypothetical protein WA026_016581 [Henosepilachna vigintioctopunctata]|uniref:DUF4817 domain-containing protein n=1 Tax=Henosepilachna vigintioctopunctata TaxID=420089 RepID=A0AAW1V8X4_9CUCU